MKGWSMVNRTRSFGSDVAIATMVAAAASVPASFTETNALCMMPLILNSRVPVMPEKSTVPEKAAGIPKADRTSFNLKLDSNLNFGMVRATGLEVKLPMCRPSAIMGHKIGR